MRDPDRTVVTFLVLLMLSVWLGFFLHRAPRFAGSLYGGLLGMGGVILMLLPLAVYSLAKRVPFFKHLITGWVPLKTLLTAHIYTALVGSILVLLHTGQKFDSPLGILLTSTVLLVTLSGFAGRYLMSHVKLSLGEKQQMLKQLRQEYALQGQQVASLSAAEPFSPSSAAHLETVWHPETQSETLASFNMLVCSIADLEYSILVHQWMTHWFQRWHQFHLVISAALIVLLSFHIWSGIYYGLRWFS